jgi:Ca-activated chloride channel homolog
MKFANPQILWLLPVAVPLLTWFLWWAWRRKQALIAQFVQSRLLAQLTVGVSPLRQKARLALIVFAVAAALLALARPQWGFDWEEAKQRGLDIVVAIDTSRSMLAEDVRPNRLARAKLAALDLMKLARNDRLALAPFAGAAFLQCPLTLDDQAFRQSVEALDVGIIPVGGTALTEAIETAFAAYKEDSDNYKILVLFTDGEDHDSGAVEAAQKAAKAGMKIFTVGVGTPNGELLRITDENGQASYVKDDQGNAVKSRLDETLLREIATVTGGFYLPLQNARTMESLYEQGLAPLPKSEISSRLVRRYHERFQWPLALAVAALLVEMLLPERTRLARSAPAVKAPNAALARAVSLVITLIALAGSFACALAGTAGQREDEDHRQRLKDQIRSEKQLKEIRRQIDEYEERLKKNPTDPRLHYNLGTFAYETEDYDTAEKELPQALHAPDLKLQQRAYYNLGNALYRIGEKTEEMNQKMEKWGAAVKDYEGAVSLDPQDADAKFNLELVKKKLEELKQQQAKQDQKQEQQPKSDNPEKQDQQKQKDPQQQQDQKQQQSKQDSKKEEEQQQQQPTQSQQEAADKQKRDAKQDKPQRSGKGEPKSGEQTETNTMAMPGQMTLQEAQQLLESQKDGERAMIFVPQQKLKDARRVFKDW